MSIGSPYQPAFSTERRAISAATTLTFSDADHIVFIPTAAATITLPVDTKVKAAMVTIYNDAASALALTVRQGTSNISTIAQNKSQTYVYDGTEWNNLDED